MLTAPVTAVRRLAATALLTALIPVTAALLVCVAVLSGPLSLSARARGRGRGSDVDPRTRRGRWRAVRIGTFVLVYLVVDVTGVFAAAVIWLRAPHRTPSDRDRLDTATYAELERLLGVLRRTAARTFGLSLRITPALRTDAGPDVERPLLVLVRHAGPGDSLLAVQSLLSGAGLRPHIVLKRILRLDPCLDILLSRLPHCFVPGPRGATTAESMAGLAARLGPGDALVLFPEGGNFTERRHERAVAALRRVGRRRAAAAAERMTHVLAPHTSGLIAVLDAAPTADVVFVAHTGLDRIDSVRGGWSALPLREDVQAHWWRIPSSEIPHGEAARSDWLLAEWARVDAWIGRHEQARD